jgi:large subunit ribosomal protein L15e
MTKGMYYYLRQAWKKPDALKLRKKIIEWRKENAITRIEKPTRLDRARSLGYKAKPGFVVARVRLMRGGRKRPRPKAGRRSKRLTIRKTLMLNYNSVAEQRAARRFRNLEVLSSYWVGQDGEYYFFEVILVDPNHPQIINDPVLRWICLKKGRAFRGLTSAGKKSRGLRAKGRRAQF